MYWEHFKNLENYPEGINEYDRTIEDLSNILDTKTVLFNQDNYLQVCAGINYYDSDKAKQLVMSKPRVEEYKIAIQKQADASMDHYEFIQKMLALQ